MYLDEIVAGQKRGEALGIASVCSAHPQVIRRALKKFAHPLIEVTCNQVNQYGGYTGMTPHDFVAYARGIAEGENIPFENIILGGDHLGPNVWQSESAEVAMQKSEVLIRDYVQAGFKKIHLDCSMKLGDDPLGMLDIEVIAERAARLAKVAEEFSDQELRYVVGSEVPIPGGVLGHEEGVSVTKAEDVRLTIEVTKEAFLKEGLESAWERVLGVVVQPGVEFGDDFILPYRSSAVQSLAQFIETQSMMYEAHSTDYQTHEALKNMVDDHFAILKVGPALTFAYREAVFGLAMIEDEWIAKDQRSNTINVLDDVMLKHPEYWNKYYRGSESDISFKRKFSLSDRARYYWGQPEVRRALECLMKNLGDEILPLSLSSQFVGQTGLSAKQVIDWKIDKVLENYCV